MKKSILKKILDQVPFDYYDKGIKNNFFQRVWHERKWKIIKNLVNKNSKDILDVGCSSGHITNKLNLFFPKANVFGIDISENFINFAKQKNKENVYKTHRKKVIFICADAHRIPFKDKSFDTILCTEMLDHVEDPKKVLREINRCLKKDGVVILSLDSVSTFFNIIWLFWVKFGPGKVWENAHLHKFTYESLKRLIISNGFTIDNKITDFFGLSFFLSIRKIN